MSTDQSKKVALPAYLPKRLEAFKIAKGDQVSYILRDKLLNKVHDIEPWQFFVLEVLPGCENYPKLLGVFEDRFARSLSEAEVQTFFGSLADRKLIDTENATHPLLAPFLVKGYELKDGKAVAKSHEAQAAAAAAATPAAAAAKPAAAAAAPAELPPGLNDAINFDPRATRKVWKLFDPKPLLKLALPALAPLRHVVYGLPLLVLAALMLSFQFSHLIFEDLERLHGTTTLLGHVVFSLFTVNLVVTLTTALVAQNYRASVNSFGISVFLGFLPRFVVEIGHVQQLSRRERMWLQAAPLLMRLALFSLGILLWYNTRDGNGVSPQIGLGLGIICAVDLLLASGNPLFKGSGYHLLSAFMNEPHLRGKSYKALLSRIKGQEFKEADNMLLVSYALASTLFSFIVILVVVLLVGSYLKKMLLGGTALILAGLLGAYLLRRTLIRFKKIEEAYNRSVQFDRWRKRALPEEAAEAQDELPPATGWKRYVQLAGVLALLVVLAMPYRYEPGGAFSVYPSDRQVITSDVAGVIEEVRFDGGETVKQGTVVAVLATTDHQAQVNILGAKMTEQEAVIAELKARPRPQEVELAQKALEVALEQEKYSKAKLPRMESLYKEGTISFEELDAAKREYLVDTTQVAEKRAALDLAKQGATKEQIDAAVAKLRSLKEERDLYLTKVGRATLTMPIDGEILTLHLKQKINSYLERGQTFATVENIVTVKTEVEIPEADISHVKPGAKVRLRPTSYSDVELIGTVTVVDRNVTPKSFGNVVKVIVDVPNKDNLLKTGMTGYAKIDGSTLPTWKAFTQVVIRFVNVQVWSWIP